MLFPATAILVSALTAHLGTGSDHYVEIAPRRTIEANLRVEVLAPGLEAKEWILVAPTPPEHPTQNSVEQAVVVLDRVERPWSTVEHSLLQRRVLTIRVPAGEKTKRAIYFHVQYRAALHARRLVEGISPSRVEPLSTEHRGQYSRSTPTVDWDSDGFQRWLKASGLLRRGDESELAFAYRVFRYIADHGKYGDPPNGDRRPSRVCTAAQSDCGGLAMLYTAVLRANGIPARTLWGRWAKPQEDGYGQHHVKAEFYAEHVGWVPVEMAGAIAWQGIDKDKCFGRDEGDFLTLHVDTDLVIDTIHFGKQDIGWRQGVLFWVTGTGTLNGHTYSETWAVK